MLENRRKSLCFVIILGFTLSFLLETIEASSTSKVAKTVAKKVIERKLHKSHSKRWFPVWLIVLLVFGIGSLIGVAIFAYCFFKRSSQTQSCFV